MRLSRLRARAARWPHAGNGEVPQAVAQQARMLSWSGQVELAVLDTANEGCPLFVSEQQHRPVRILGVPDSDDVREVVGNLDAVVSAAAIASGALAPVGA